MKNSRTGPDRCCPVVIQAADTPQFVHARIIWRAGWVLIERPPEHRIVPRLRIRSANVQITCLTRSGGRNCQRHGGRDQIRMLCTKATDKKGRAGKVGLVTPVCHMQLRVGRCSRAPPFRSHTPGGTGVNYPRFIPMTWEIDLATILFEQARAMMPSSA
jgi:hypothetical protein